MPTWTDNLTSLAEKINTEAQNLTPGEPDRLAGIILSTCLHQLVSAYCIGKLAEAEKALEEVLPKTPAGEVGLPPVV